MKTTSRKDPGLSRQPEDGAPVPLDVIVRTKLKERLEQIAAHEGRSLDFVVDEILRWAAERYLSCAGLGHLCTAAVALSKGPEGFGVVLSIPKFVPPSTSGPDRRARPGFFGVERERATGLHGSR